MKICKDHQNRWACALPFLLIAFLMAIPLSNAFAQTQEGLSQQERNSIISAISQDNKLVATDGAIGDGFGRSVSISGDWGQVKKLLPADGAAADYFGESVAISGDTIIVGAWLDDDNG
ncbi:FG-GAP repeat protein, partial [Thiolapillus sp.]